MATELEYQPQFNGSGTRFVLLDQSYCEAVVELEQRCYSHPWSPALIRGEFQKDVSLRCALVAPSPVGVRPEIIAYSFSYLVEDELHILNLAVNPKLRSRGFGKQLLRRLLQHSYRLGARSATLEVRQSNYIAKRLYAGIGFEVLGMRKNYYRDNSEHALVLQCVLDRGLIEPPPVEFRGVADCRPRHRFPDRN